MPTVSLSIEEQRELLKQARKDKRRLSLPEKWAEEEKMNKQLGVYKDKPETFKAREVNDEEFKELLGKYSE